jgi:hypothetical protein
MLLNESLNNNKKTNNRDICTNSPLLTNKSELSCETSSLSSKSTHENNSKNRNTSLTLSFSSSSSTTTKTNTTKTTTKSEISSLSSSVTSLITETTTTKILNKNYTNLTAPYYGKKYHGKEWLFKKLHDYIINKVYEKPFFLILIGDSGNGKTHLCCELKWPTSTIENNNNKNTLLDLNKHLISTYFLSLYNLTQNSYYKNLHNLYTHLKNTILNELPSKLNIDSFEQTNDCLRNCTTNSSFDDEEDDETDESCFSNNDEYNDHIINKYVTKFNEDILNLLNKSNNEIIKQNKNFYILIDGIDELLLYDQYLTRQNLNNNNNNFNLILKFLNKIFFKFPKWLHLIVTCKRLTEKQNIRNKYFNNIKNYFKLSIDMCVSLNSNYLNIINEKEINVSSSSIVNSNYSLVSYENDTVVNNNVILSSSSSTTSSSSSRLTSSSFEAADKQQLKSQPESLIIQSNSLPTIATKQPTSAEILNAAHFASLKDIQIYILKRLDNDNELKLKFNKLNAIEMLNLLLIKSNNCLLYVEKVLDLILLNIINSREIRDIPVTIYGLYLFLIERLLTDLNSAADDYRNEQQPVIKQLIYSIFNLFIVELRPISKLKLYLKLKLKYNNLDYNYYEYIFNSIIPILFTKCQNEMATKQQQQYVLFHSSLIEWFSDVKFCTNKYLFNLSEGHFILMLFYFNKFKKQNFINEQTNSQLNYITHKKLLKLFKNFQFHLLNSYQFHLTCVEYNYLLNLCESSSSVLLNYELINDLLFNNNKKDNSDVGNAENLNDVKNSSDNLTNSNYSIKKICCDSGLDLDNNYEFLLFNFVANGLYFIDLFFFTW